MLNWLRSIFPKKISSRNLSELFEGELEITIEGIGTKKMNWDYGCLATHVATTQIMLSFEKNDCSALIVNDVANAPWEIVSFDRAAKKLVVRPVK